MVVALIWVALTAVGVWWAITADLQPLGASREAGIVDDAFQLLTILSVPVFMFVIVVLGYSMYRFRASHQETDGAPHASNRLFIALWVSLTSALAVFVIFFPGVSGLAELGDEPEYELTVDVVAAQWNWTIGYPDLNVIVPNADELVLPLDRRVLFRILSTDVIHSFWIPAFRIKADAVPGLVHETLVTPTELGTFTANPGFRVQCAELCGTGHTRMAADVRVVTASEFEAWVAEREGVAP